MDISELRIAIVNRGLLSKPWLEKIRAQLAETFKETNMITDEETTQTADVNRESRSLENPELDKIKREFYKALK